MKILMVNKFLYPRGGAETYIFKLGQILEEHGHQVQYFGMYDDKNIVGNHADSYVSSQDFQTGILRNLTAPFRIIYNAEARRKISKVLKDFEPDVVHLNNIQFHLTPSIIVEINKYRKQIGHDLKIIYTAHDFQLICPSHGLFDSDIHPCERCLKGNFLHCFKIKCMKNSRAKSLLAMMDAYFWKYNKAYDYVDAIICPSSFLKEKLDTQKRLSQKTTVIHNFVDIVKMENIEKKDYVLYFGKLCKEKGTYTLAEVCRRMPDVKFVFAGYGPAEKCLRNLPNVLYVGFKSGKELKNLIQQARISVCPSEWYENCPFSVIESQMYLTPVIGSRMGGIPELIREGETGELFEAGNVDELEKKICKLFDTPGLIEQFTENCKHLEFETPESYYLKLMNVYGGYNEDL